MAVRPQVTVSKAISKKARRTHAERRAATQARLKDAVLESIEAVGLERTTASEIARRAGVSWGAVQHHYGDKRGILIAVLEDSTNRFIAHLEQVAVEGRSREQRVSDFVDRAWEHFQGAHYRSTFEILLHLSGADEDLADLPRSLAELQGPSWAAIWRRIFHDAALAPARDVALQHYASSVLSGIASLRILEGGEAQRDIELGFLKDTLNRELRAG